MQSIHISRLHFPVTTLGPGKRIGIWFQGCSIRCEGCVSADTWRHGIGETTISNVIQQVGNWLDFADGVTITGGEPFEQPAALIQLVQWLNRAFAGDVLVYTGFRKAQIAAVLDDLDGCIDALISEPFDHRASDKLPLRGSDNQKLHFLTSRGRSLYFAYGKPSNASAMDVMFDEDGTVWFCGIPKRQDLARLQQVLRSQGHEIVFTAQKVRGE